MRRRGEVFMLIGTRMGSGDWEEEDEEEVVEVGALNEVPPQ